MRPDRFGKIVVLSGGFILKRALGAPEQAPVPHGRRSYYNRIFGDLDHLPGSEKDYDALARRFKDDPTLPKPTSTSPAASTTPSSRRTAPTATCFSTAAST